MNNAVLHELAKRWESDAEVTELQSYEDSPRGLTQQGKDIGRRETLRECADALRMLTSLLD